MGKHERGSYLEDLNAIEHAKTPSAVSAIARAMKGTGRWTAEAERASASALRRLAQRNPLDPQMTN